MKHQKPKQFLFSCIKNVKTYPTNPSNRVEVLFVAIATVTGMAMAFMIPPLQGADEPNHFMRAYQISQGQFLPQNEGPSVGGQLPKNIVTFTSLSLEVVRPGTTLDKLTAEDWQKLASIPNNKHAGEAASTTDELRAATKLSEAAPLTAGATFSNTAVYSPVAYAPRVITLWATELFGASPLTMMYISRVVGLLVAIAIIAWAIRLLPFGKLPAAIGALIPMSVAQLAVVSADAMVIALAFLAVALTLHLSFRAKPLTGINFIGLLSVFAALSLTKPALFPLAIITLALLANKAIPKRYAIGAVVAVCGAAVIATLAWNSAIQEYAIRGFEADVRGVNYSDQLHFILTQPFEYAQVVVRTLFTERFDPIPQQFIGSFGWLDTRLPYVVVIITFVIIACSILISSLYEKTVMPWWVRLTALVGAIGVAMATFTSQYLLWISVQKSWNDGLQGRYFLPAVPAFIFAFLGGKSVIDEAYYRRLTHKVFLAIALVLIIALVFIAARFYGIFGFLMPQ